MSDNRRIVLFVDGTWQVLPVLVIGGPALRGQPTAYVEVDGKTVWVAPLEGTSGVYLEQPAR